MSQLLPPVLAANAATLTSLMRSLEDFLQSIAPQAQRLDQDAQALGHAFGQLGQVLQPLPGLALRVPVAWGGAGLGGADYWRFQAAIARTSGALAFLQTQHQSAASLIAQGQNDQLKAQLPALAQGQTRVGVGFSHLRRRGQPCLRATATGQGDYCLQGIIPWATGWGIFQQIVVGASLNDGRSLLALIPFPPCPDTPQPMELAAMPSSNTVALQLHDYPVPQQQVIDIKPVNWLQQGDRRNLLSSTSLVLGCAEAALDLMAATIQTRHWTELDADYQRLASAVRRCREEILQELLEPQLPFEQRLALRAEALMLCGRCAQGAIALAAGAANLMDHPAQRIYREALLFTVTGQTAAIRSATLRALSRELE